MLNHWRSILIPSIPLYVLLLTAFSGAIFLDIFYSRSLSFSSSPAERDGIFRSVSDMLLKIGFVVFLSGGAAIFAAWNERRTLVYLLASVLTFSAIEFLAPIFMLGPLKGNELGLSLGPVIRVFGQLAAVLFAATGLERFRRSQFE